MESHKIFTDGACSGNPGPGGWAGVINYPNGKHVFLYGYERDTTNNRMELLAAINALKYMISPRKVTITTDSKYVKQGITEWIKRWKKNGWRTASRKPVMNQDLWKELDSLNKTHNVSWKWVKGHDGHALNEAVDQLAVTTITDGEAGKLNENETYVKVVE